MPIAAAGTVAAEDSTGLEDSTEMLRWPSTAVKARIKRTAAAQGVQALFGIRRFGPNEGGTAAAEAPHLGFGLRAELEGEAPAAGERAVGGPGLPVGMAVEAAGSCM